jgi:aminoglycoside phosphotransferase family enzyme/predicted kinase
MPDDSTETLDQTETIEFLADGASHGMPGATVERRETHISYVFLVGDRVLKLKRAVTFDYLDFASVTQREAACLAELHINRRTAPDLYLGVRKIARQANGTLAFDSEGPAVDWVVEMRRFEDDGLFDRLAESRRLTPPLMRALADEIARFHATAEPNTRAGGANAMAAIIAGNDTNLRAAGALFDGDAVTRLRETATAALADIAVLLDRRRDRGHVRRCHGDLHLGNICLYQGRPTLFDAIEFSDVFGTIDVLYDAAFLLMDLLHRGLPDLANLVANRYLDRSGEGDGLQALPLFLSQRAAIRAHVTAAAHARRTKDDQAEAMAATARAYLALAHDLLQGAPPRLVAIGGFSGTGKSTVAQGLAPLFLPAPGARVLRSDVRRKLLAGVEPETRLPPTAYDTWSNRRVYDALEAEAAATLAAGYSVIVDAAYLREDERRSIAAVAARAGAPFAGLWLAAPADRLRARIAGRRGDASDADLAVLEAQLGYDLGTLDWRRVHAEGDPGRTLAESRATLGFPSGGDGSDRCTANLPPKR